MSRFAEDHSCFSILGNLHTVGQPSSNGHQFTIRNQERRINATPSPIKHVTCDKDDYVRGQLTPTPTRGQESVDFPRCLALLLEYAALIWFLEGHPAWPDPRRATALHSGRAWSLPRPHQLTRWPQGSRPALAPLPRRGPPQLVPEGRAPLLLGFQPAPHPSRQGTFQNPAPLAFFRKPRVAVQEETSIHLLSADCVQGRGRGGVSTRGDPSVLASVSARFPAPRVARGPPPLGLDPVLKEDPRRSRNGRGKPRSLPASSPLSAFTSRDPREAAGAKISNPRGARSRARGRAGAGSKGRGPGDSPAPPQSPRTR
nr:uncharacterized protein LOC123569782 [Macaca fascicularis]